ncbi:hypothetical protein [Paraclostridium bifermentans]|uniref:hypothetical protein n=1 Tax=Paraclostridium bifermentans TaxID=1490 RepID=UPI0022E49EDD|nr:hypothetical protein [Paraclostridium bifermentans]
MSLSDFFNPSTTIGALFIGIIAGLISGIIIGFFTGKATTINKLKTKGDNSPIINNSSFGGNNVK